MSKLLEQPYFLTELSKQFQIDEWIKLRTVCKAFNASFSLEHSHHTKRHCLWTQKLFEKACETQKIHLITQVCPLTLNINPAACSNEAIRWASQNGHLKVLKYLVSLKKEFPKIDPTVINNWPIRWASPQSFLPS